jgi:hypothetical protein
MPTSSLILELRRRIRDTRFSRRALGVAVNDPSASSALAEVTNNHLVVTVFGGSGTPSLDLNLSDPRYNTIGRLFNAISRVKNYKVSIDEDAERDHQSTDLEPFGPMEVSETGVDLVHRNFSDSELEGVISEATQRHNPTFNISSLPSTEEVFVLQFAQAIVCRIQAYDATKRKGMDAESGTLLQMARDLEEAYGRDTTRLKRAITSPLEASPNTMAQGDIVTGLQYKRSLRTGQNAPMSGNLPPTAAVLLEPNERDQEDTNIKFQWQRNHDYDFYSYELWLDTRPDVIRVREGVLFANVPFAITPKGPNFAGGLERSTTSKLVFRSFGANSNFQTVAFHTFVEEFGQLITSYVLPDLEPELDYYARLYIIDLNYESVASNVVRYRTKPLRAKFLIVGTPIAPTSGPNGTVISIVFDPSGGPFYVGQSKIMVGGIFVPDTNIVYTDGYHITAVVPSFVQKGPKDVVVQSPTNLTDLKKLAFEVTA